jgi:hypothetical protein
VAWLLYCCCLPYQSARINTSEAMTPAHKHPNPGLHSSYVSNLLMSAQPNQRHHCCNVVIVVSRMKHHRKGDSAGANAAAAAVCWWLGRCDAAACLGNSIAGPVKPCHEHKRNAHLVAHTPRCYRLRHSTVPVQPSNQHKPGYKHPTALQSKLLLCYLSKQN